MTDEQSPFRPGTKRSRCTVCGKVFDAPSAADAHRVVAGVYALVRDPDGRLRRVPYSGTAPKLAGLVSGGNQVRRCLADDELTARGLVIKANGTWGAPSDGSRWVDDLDLTASQPDPYREPRSEVTGASGLNREASAP